MMNGFTARRLAATLLIATAGFGVSPGARAEDACERLVTVAGQGIRHLMARAPAVKSSWSPPSELSLLTPADCADAKRRPAAVRAIGRYLSMEGAKTVIALPLTGVSTPWGEALLAGIKAAWSDRGRDFAAETIVVDTSGVPAIAETRLAEVLLRHPVGLIITGATRAEAGQLAPIAGSTLTSTLLLSPGSNIVSKYLFQAGPLERHLTDALVAAAERRRWKRVAILRPSGGKADSTIDAFMTSAKASGIDIPFDIAYASINYRSMQDAAERLFQIDPLARKDELDQLTSAAREKAATDKTPFNPKSVILPPIADFDAVFIPDDYRVVRHMARLFKYLGAKNFRMIGNQEWRSPALVTPREPLLDGSVFADIIGPYESLPPSLRPPTVGGPLFADPARVTATDGGVIGYRAADIALGALSMTPAAKLRSDIAKRLPILRGSRMPMFQNRQAFDPHGKALWPAAIFAVSSDQITFIP